MEKMSPQSSETTGDNGLFTMTKSKKKRMRRSKAKSNLMSGLNEEDIKSVRGDATFTYENSTAVQLYGSQHQNVEDITDDVIEIKTRGFMLNEAIEQRATKTGYKFDSSSGSSKAYCDSEGQYDSDQEDCGYFSSGFHDRARRHHKTSAKKETPVTKSEEVDGFVGDKDLNFVLDYIEGQKSKQKRNGAGKNKPSASNKTKQQNIDKKNNNTNVNGGSKQTKENINESVKKGKEM